MSVQFLTIHCAATPEGRDNKAHEIRAWDIARFGQPSYHRVYELDGTCAIHLNDESRGAHVAKRNTGNIGFCYVGGLAKDGKTPKDTRTDAQRAAMLKDVRLYIARYPILKTPGPDGKPRVRGHRDWEGVSKACPSFDVAGWLKAEGVLK